MVCHRGYCRFCQDPPWLNGFCKRTRPGGDTGEGAVQDRRRDHRRASGALAISVPSEELQEGGDGPGWTLGPPHCWFPRSHGFYRGQSRGVLTKTSIPPCANFCCSGACRKFRVPLAHSPCAGNPTTVGAGNDVPTCPNGRMHLPEWAAAPPRCWFPRSHGLRRDHNRLGTALI